MAITQNTALYAFFENRLWVRFCQDTAGFSPVKPPTTCEMRFNERFLTFDGTAVVQAVDLKNEPQLEKGESLVGLRELYDYVAPAEYAYMQRAFQVLHWRRTHRFCGACGGALTRKNNEHAMTCPACKLDFFPRLNPVVIVRISRGKTLLLARRARGILPFFSVIAGFVEAGETLEAAVAREIREEVGIKVKNIRYFANQPWPFPNNLMIGFTAEHASGEIQVDGVEISEADWYPADALPKIPHPISISRWLIDDFLKKQTPA